MKHIKSTLWTLIALMTISSCSKESSLEPLSITVSETKGFNVRYASTGYYEYFDSTFTSTSSKYSCEEIVIWESEGKYWGKYLKDGKWYVMNKELTAYKM